MKERIAIGLDSKLIVRLEDIGFANKIKTRPKIIKYLIEKYESDLQ